MIPKVISVLGLMAAATRAHGSNHHHDHDQLVLAEGDVDISSDVRSHWMRVAEQSLYDLVSPCPFSAFGAAIVNHTASDRGELVCIGVNTIADDGNPTLHGEIAAINNCTSVMRDPEGHFRLSPEETSAAWKQLSLYTTAEACPMCASAIRWAGFKEYIYATSSETLLESGWPQMSINSRELFRRSGMLEPETAVVENVLHSETDPLFAWQFDSRAPCPAGCSRETSDGSCAPA